MGKIPAWCRASRQAHTTSRGLGATLCRYHGRSQPRCQAAPRATWVRNHRVRATAMTQRNVLTPMLRCHVRHCSCPRPSQAWVSRSSSSTAQRSRSSPQMTSRLKVRAVVNKASTAGRGVWRPGVLMPRGASRRTLTTWRSRPGNTACHRPLQACTSAPTALG